MSGAEKTKPEVISFLTLRRAIGILGIALPVILVLGSVYVCKCNGIEVSISNYYHTCMRNVFVGIMCVVAIFFFAYKGYERRDNIAAHFAFVFALGIAWLPTSYKAMPCNIVPISENALVGKLHLASAFLFFMVLIYFSLVLFTKSDKDKTELTKQKKNRNRVYKTCAYIMMACIALIVIYIPFRGNHPKLDALKPVFWFEAVALWAFGISWLTKGEVLWRDAK